MLGARSVADVSIICTALKLAVADWLGACEMERWPSGGLKLVNEIV